MEDRNYCVYKHISPSGKVYIGITKQTPNGRWKNGKGYQTSPHFWNAIQKYGWDNFSHEVLDSELTVEEACSKEQELIAYYRSENPAFGYNERSGGQLGSSLNDAARSKISQRLKEYYLLHPEEREKIAERSKGQVWDDERRKKLSDSKKGKPIPIDDEWRAKMIAGTRKRYQEDDALREEATMRCISNGMSRRKPVEQLSEDGKVIAWYESGKAAKRATGIYDGNIIRCCKGLSIHAGGYKWRYAIDDNDVREDI